MSKVMINASETPQWDPFPKIGAHSLRQPVSDLPEASEAPVLNADPAATQKANSNETESTNSSEDDTTPDSTFSAPIATPSGLESPASSVCADNLDSFCRPQGEEEATPAVSPAPEPEGERHVPQITPTTTSSSVWRFLSPTRRQLKSKPPQTTEYVPTGLRAVVVSIEETDKIYAFKGAPGLYVAFEDLIRPPAELLQRWERVTEARFWTDAREFQNKILKTKTGRRHPPGMSLELRMSGYASSPRSTHVQLVPRIWVLYDHDRWAREIKKFVRESEWLQREGFGEVEVRKGSPRLATFEAPIFLEELNMDPESGFPIGNNSLLYLHVEHRPGTSAVGLLCCATIMKDGFIRGQRVSRLGGLVAFNHGTTSLAITTAHGMLELAWDTVFDDTSDPDDVSEVGECSPDAGYESDGSSDIDDTTWSDALPTQMSTFNMEEVRDWDSVEILGVTSFLGNSSVDLSSIASTRQPLALEHPPDNGLREDTDFSLWRIARSTVMKNKYRCPVSDKQVLIRDTLSFRFHRHDLKRVSILLGPEHVVEAHMIPGVSHFMVHGKQFTTRKIRMDAPLGPGCSGSWVVQDDLLVGMVIASYDCDPFAHIITSPDLFTAISHAVPQIKSFELHEMVSPLLWSEWNRHAEATTRVGQSDGRSNLGNSTNTIPVPRIDLAAEEAVLNSIMTEKLRDNRSTIPLHMTPGKLADLERALTKIGREIERLFKLFPLWFNVSKDNVRATALINLRRDVMGQYQYGPPQERVLKKYPSITPDELENGQALLDSIARDLATDSPSFLKRSNLKKHTNSTDPNAERTGPPLIGSSAAPGSHKRPHAQSHCLSTGEIIWSSVADDTSRKRRRDTLFPDRGESWLETPEPMFEQPWSSWIDPQYQWEISPFDDAGALDPSGNDPPSVSSLGDLSMSTATSPAETLAITPDNPITGDQPDTLDSSEDEYEYDVAPIAASFKDDIAQPVLGRSLIDLIRDHVRLSERGEDHGF